MTRKLKPTPSVLSISRPVPLPLGNLLEMASRVPYKLLAVEAGRRDALGSAKCYLLEYWSVWLPSPKAEGAHTLDSGLHCY